MIPENKMTSGKSDHQYKASQMPPARLSIVTVSDSRKVETDTNGLYLKEQVAQAGFVLVDYSIVPDEPDIIDALIETLMKTDTQIILFNGGTGMSKRDTTFDVISRKLEKVMPGFGEIFRMLSYDQVGAAAMFSRAVAGVYKGKVIISTPGSPAAVQLAWEKLIAPEIQHLAWEINR
jgi:molybdenum cofactor biosynthesis protein B